MNAITETEVVQACQKLFGEEMDISRDFLYYSIQPSGVKSAYRKKAKETHPDLFAADPPHVQKKQTALFREILQAYDVLTLFFKQREEGAWRPGKSAGPFVRRAQPKKESPARDYRASRSGEDLYYRGPMPSRPLQIGQYLYYSGKITFAQLINALIWQRKQRPTIGDIAVQWGLLDSQGVDKIFSLCGRPRLFGEKAVELGLLTVFHVNTILLYQRSLQSRLGSYFVEKGILPLHECEQLAGRLREHNAAVLAGAADRRYRQKSQA